MLLSMKLSARMLVSMRTATVALLVIGALIACWVMFGGAGNGNAVEGVGPSGNSQVSRNTSSRSIEPPLLAADGSPERTGEDTSASVMNGKGVKSKWWEQTSAIDEARVAYPEFLEAARETAREYALSGMGNLILEKTFRREVFRSGDLTFMLEDFGELDEFEAAKVSDALQVIAARADKVLYNPDLSERQEDQALEGARDAPLEFPPSALASALLPTGAVLADGYQERLSALYLEYLPRPAMANSEEELVQDAVLRSLLQGGASFDEVIQGREHWNRVSSEVDGVQADLAQINREFLIDFESALQGLLIQE